MLNAGVKGPPRIAKVTPVEDSTRKEALAGVIVRHEVADYAAWKRVVLAQGGDAARRRDVAAGAELRAGRRLGVMCLQACGGLERALTVVEGLHSTHLARRAPPS